MVRGGTIFRVNVEKDPPDLVPSPNDGPNLHQNIGVPDAKTPGSPNPPPKY